MFPSSLGDCFALGLWLDTSDEQRAHGAGTTKFFHATEGVSTPCDTLTFPPSLGGARTLDDELPYILGLLSHDNDRMETLRKSWTVFIGGPGTSFP